MIRILIVEDEPLIAADIEETCNEYGYSVTKICHTCDEALEAINTEDIDYILLDIQLGDKDLGLEFGRIL